HVCIVALDAGGREGFVENPSGRSDEWTPFDILSIARRLADEHYARIRNAFTEDGLRRVFPERATATRCRGATDGWQRAPTGEEIARRRTRPAVVSGTTRRSAGAGIGRRRTRLPRAGRRTSTRRTRSAAR